MRKIVPFALSLSFAAVLSGQTQKVISVPAVEDIKLYASFFNYHQGLINAMQAAGGQNVATQNQQMAALLGVSVADLPAVIANTQSVTQSYSQIASRRLTTLPNDPSVAVPPVPPTAAQLSAEFDLMQARATVEGAHNLFLKISPSSWAGIHAYILGTYKATIYKP